jgi:3-dehydroquinate synthase
MHTVTMNLGERSYPIVIEAGCLPCAGAFVREFCGDKAREAAVVTSETVARLYLGPVAGSLEKSGFRVVTVVLPDGEEHKTVATWESILTRLIEERFERSSVIVALGGGVVGDVAGFAASAFLRGVSLVQIPTTIVAQVDSSIGGKVAVNHPLGKNLIGSFHQPRGVFIDTRVLATLAPREVVSGMGEVVKHAVIGDETFFSFLEEHLESIMGFEAEDEVMERFIEWNCRIKARVVSEDERERGVRAHLNYGHTVGHALETVTGYTRFSHGEAVALGMIAAAAIARARGLLSPGDEDRQNALLDRVGVNCAVGDIAPGAVLDAMRRDKKVSGGRIRFVLPPRIGAAEVFADVSEEEILRGVESMRARCAQ